MFTSPRFMGSVLCAAIALSAGSARAANYRFKAEALPKSRTMLWDNTKQFHELKPEVQQQKARRYGSQLYAIRTWVDGMNALAALPEVAVDGFRPVKTLTPARLNLKLMDGVYEAGEQSRAFQFLFHVRDVSKSLKHALSKDIVTAAPVEAAKLAASLKQMEKWIGNVDVSGRAVRAAKSKSAYSEHTWDKSSRESILVHFTEFKAAKAELLRLLALIETVE